MIPNLFVSSTISDLQYLREALRDAITEVAYNPVMSEHGGVGFIHEGSAADACYVTMQQCHIAILIIGKKYGNIWADGISVTHQEFRTAKENSIPLITFVDTDVMAFKKVFDADPTSGTWDKFDHMDNPRQTFTLVDEVKSSDIFNGMIEYRTAGEAKVRMKQQLAHFMGDRLIGSVRPIKGDVKEILAEVKALRNFLDNPPEIGKKIASKAADPFYISLRFLLEERNKNYTQFVEKLFGDIDNAAHQIQTASNIDELIAKSGVSLQIMENLGFISSMRNPSNGQIYTFISNSGMGDWAITKDKDLVMSQSMYDGINDLQKLLSAKISGNTEKATAELATAIV